MRRLVLLAATAGMIAWPTLAAGEPAVPVDPVVASDELAAALQATVARADGDIVSEVEAGGYRIGLVLGPARPVRPRMASGRFVPPEPPDPDQTFVGVVVREPRTKRFLPAAAVRVNLEMEGGGELDLPELAGPYPIYGMNLRIPKPGTVSGPSGPDDLRAIAVTVGPPAYNRHAEMLTAFAGEAVTRFVVVPRTGAKGPPWHLPKEPVKPRPVAGDWTIGDDLRMAVGESRQLVRSGPFLLGFIAEGPEPIWLWKSAQHPPECQAVAPNHNTHLELFLVHVPSGLMVTGAQVSYAFWRRPRPDAPREEKTFLLRPLLAEFYHYGLTVDLPAGGWNLTAQVTPSWHEAWGEGDVPVPEQKLIAAFTYEREAAGAEGPDVEAARFAQRLADAAAKYVAGDRTDSLAEMTEAFFAFEGSGLDARLRASDPSGYKAIEAEWIALRARMQAGAGPTEVETAAKDLGARLVALAGPAAGAGGTGGAGAFIRSFLVLLREGVEAILVLGLLAAALRKTRRHDALRVLWGGALAALVASAVLAVASLLLFRGVAGTGGRAREALEGVTLLLATAVLFVTSFWLISRVEGRRWAEFVRHQVESAVTSNRRRAVGALAFLVVFREGAETVLLYASLFAASPGAAGAIVAGLGAAAIALVVIFFLSIRGGAMLPIRPFFGITGAFLYVLAFKFAGDAVSELQAAALVPATPLTWIPRPPLLRSWLGVHPTLEAALVQGLLLVAVVAGLAWTLLRRPPGSEAASGVAAG